MLFAPGKHEIVAQGGRHFIVRPVGPDDEPLLAEMFSKSSREDIRFRCLGAIKDFPRKMAERLTRIDGERETTLVGLDGENPREIAGVVHVVTDSNAPSAAEFDVMVRADLKGQGLGYCLMMEILAHARQRGLRTVEGYILRENTTMLQMAGGLGFGMSSAEGGVVRVAIELSSPCLTQAGPGGVDHDAGQDRRYDNPARAGSRKNTFT